MRGASVGAVLPGAEGAPRAEIGAVAGGAVVGGGLEVGVVDGRGLLGGDACPVGLGQLHAETIVGLRSLGDGGRVEAVGGAEALQVAAEAGTQEDGARLAQVGDGREETGFAEEPHGGSPFFGGGRGVRIGAGGALDIDHAVKAPGNVDRHENADHDRPDHILRCHRSPSQCLFPAQIADGKDAAHPADTSPLANRWQKTRQT